MNDLTRSTEAEAILADAINDYRSGDLDESHAKLIRLSRTRERDTDFDDTDVWYFLGLIAFWRGNLEDARTHLLEAIKRDPSKTNALFYMAEVAAREGKIEEAVQYLENTIAEAPSHEEARERLEELRTLRRVAQVPHAQPPPPTAPSRPPVVRGVKGAVYINMALREAHRRQQQAAVPPPSQEPVAAKTGEQPKFAVEPAPQGLIGQVSAVWPLDATSIGFRLRPWSPENETLPEVPVEMRGPSRRGSIAPNDWVQLPVDERPVKPLLRVTNLTTGETVEMRHVLFRNIVVALFALGFIAIVSTVLIAALGPFAPIALILIAAVVIFVVVRHRSARAAAERMRERSEFSEDDGSRGNEDGRPPGR
jgi:Tetratricopeptide repeat